MSVGRPWQPPATPSPTVWRQTRRWSVLLCLLIATGPTLACAPAPELAVGCQGCHGHANESAMAVPLYGQDAATLEAKLRAYAADHDDPAPGVMQRMLHGISPELLTRLAAHFACEAP